MTRPTTRTPGPMLNCCGCGRRRSPSSWSLPTIHTYMAWGSLGWPVYNLNSWTVAPHTFWFLLMHHAYCIMHYTKMCTLSFFTPSYSVLCIIKIIWTRKLILSIHFINTGFDIITEFFHGPMQNNLLWYMYCHLKSSLIIFKCNIEH